MNIFDIYLEKITKIIKSESKNNTLKLPDKLDSVNVEIPPKHFDCDVSTNVSMVLAKPNSINPNDLAKKISELIKPEYSVEENCYTNTLSVNESINKLFTVSPNPFSSSIILSGYNYNGDISFKVYDLNSKLVLEGKTLTDTPVRITGIMNGIYFIKLKFGNRVETHRIIKT